MDARHELLMILQGFAKSMALNSICKLGIPDVLNRAGSNTFMCVDEIAKQLPSNHADTPSLVKILNDSVAFGLLAAKRDDISADGRVAKQYYGLNALSSLSLPGCLAPVVIMQMHPVAQAPWLHLADAVLTEDLRFHHRSWQARDDSEWNTVLNECMAAFSTLINVEALVGKYEDFKNVKTLVDVKGGTGLVVREIVKKHAYIHGIVFDLPHAIVQAPPSYDVEGVEFVGGDMFEGVPTGDAIFMKMIMHDWHDERCIQILRNCMKAIPDHGKVIICDAVVPEEVKDSFNVLTTCVDLTMLAHGDGGKERTKAEWTKLLGGAGFARIRLVQLSLSEGFDQWLIEGYKN